MSDYRVTIVFDYSTDVDDVDEDELHDAIMESFDTIDLEFTSNFLKYDENGDELEDDFTVVTVNCDNLRDVTIEKLGS
jgi:hypothetical protein